jgi:energy-converting hydrogenase A subunit M
VKFLYEKDLRPLKYNILTSTKHDAAVRAIARRLGVSDAKLRRLLIQRLDMSLLENIETRWEMGLRYADEGDPLAKELGCELFTRYIPLLDMERMKEIYEETRALARDMPIEEAIARGRERIREAVIS